MKENEFRIGNAIEIYDPIEKMSFIETITRIDIDSVNTTRGIAKYDEYDQYGVLASFILKPIPLTEEWLLNFGFQLNRNDDCVFINIHKNTYLNIDLISHVVRVYYQHKTSVIIAKCDYVHQLQNLYFALTGKELK